MPHFIPGRQQASNFCSRRKAIVFVIGVLFTGARGLNITDCMESTEGQLCYHCDSSQDSHCGNPFQYSHYYGSANVYLTQCEGCCIKIVHPSGNGTRRRIQRSCTDLLPEVNFMLTENCDASNRERQICICKRGLCNDGGAVRPWWSQQVSFYITWFVLYLAISL
ncbi:protein quiver [Folsomia candida]|uniref:UPAR/Ly6 domain-containing protein qvr n=1 Tax=Folsomia candida TaxID=158441 RepID=A0A226EYN6_FOLCA|nr:protein quiver [Folsomia candida]OXA62725.1 Protein quiver [Folsomia candida]